MSVDPTPTKLNRSQRRAAARKAGKRARTGVGALLSVAMIAGSLGVPSAASAVTETDPEFRVNKADLEFILKQIKISENHAAGGNLVCEDPADLSGDCVPDPKLPWGLRTVDGTYNNLQPDQETFGAGAQVFPRLLTPEFKPAGPMPDMDGPGPMPGGQPTSYAQKKGYVADAEPRIISNLIVDQTVGNPAAVDTAKTVDGSKTYDHDGNPATPDRLFIPNVSPDEGLSAPFSSWFTIFGQFFDHGLDLVSKGGSGTVMVPLEKDDPLYVEGSHTNFLVLTRATNLPGPDGVIGDNPATPGVDESADDIQEHTNRTTPFIDQNQTYTSNASHQSFLREYKATPRGPVPTGELLEGLQADGASREGLATWKDIKDQARTVLGIELDDKDVLNVPMIAADPYGRFIKGPNGLPQLVVPVDASQPDSASNRKLVEGNLASPIDASQALRVNHAFLDDIAHSASPLGSRGESLTADDDLVAGTSMEEAPAGRYDNELLDSHFTTGDGRGNENIGLSAVHHVFHSEHNRLVHHIDEVLEATGDEAFIAEWHAEAGKRGWDYGERLFQAARLVTEMQYQHLVFEEFARTIQPTIDAQPLNETAYHSDIDPAVSAEFGHVVYRFGHSMLTDEIAREGFGTTSIPLLDGFLNPAEFTDNGRLTPNQGAASIIQGLAKQTGNGIDEFVEDTVRSNLLGLPLDLAAINITRGRETGIPSLQTARATFYAATQDAAVEPYESWEDFRLSMKNPASIVNFVAAYGNHASVQEATTVAAKREAAKLLVQDGDFMNAPAADSGLNDVDFWMGGLAERAMVFGGMLGTTFNYVFEDHMEDLQNADRFYYLNRMQGTNIIHQLENNSFSQLVMRNTDASLLPANIFADPDAVFDLANLPAALPAGFSRMNDGTYRYEGPEHIVIHGTKENDGIRSGDGDDSVWGHDGADKIEGGVGNDTLHGGQGNDVLTDLFGDDTIHGGHGDDAINAGAGADILFGGFGKDFILHGQEVTQSFAGADTDFVAGGNANDILTGNEEDDWLEGGKGHDLVQGDNALTFQNDPNGGADVLNGGSGNDDHDAEGGDDIMQNNGIDRHAGMMGFDWVTHQHDPLAGNADLDVSIFQPLNVIAMRARFDSIQGLSGADKNDVLRGSGAPGDLARPDGAGNELTQEHLTQVVGLRELLGGGENPVHAAPFLATNESNNILVGGKGSDLIEGRRGNDYIDGDAALKVSLVGPGGEKHDSMQPFQARIFDGTLKSGDLNIVREIVLVPEPEVVDTAQFSDVAASYDITENADGTWTVAHVAGTQEDGTDTLRNIERLTFTDQSIMVDDLRNTAATGTINITGAPTEGQTLTAVRAFEDADGINEGTVVYTWQQEVNGSWVGTATGNGAGTTFVPTDAEVGSRLRVVATFQDNKGVTESITSAPTAVIANVNDVPTGTPALSRTPQVGVAVSAVTTSIVDGDGLTNPGYTYQWQSRGLFGNFTNIGGATGASYTPSLGQVGRQLRVVVSFTDDHGTREVLTSASQSIRLFGIFSTGTTTFTDTAASAHADAIEIAAAAGIAAGTGDGTTFAPQADVTRGQMATFLMRALELPEATASAGFSDVADGDTHKKAIEAVAAAGITTGKGDGTFAPKADVTRGQMATFLMRALDLPEATTPASFSDVPEDHAHKKGIDAVKAAGITMGRSDGTFDPNGSVSREQMATFIVRALDR
jgi:Ca2+-binding RTX toxin-like protein